MRTPLRRVQVVAFRVRQERNRHLEARRGGGDALCEPARGQVVAGDGARREAGVDAARHAVAPLRQAGLAARRERGAQAGVRPRVRHVHRYSSRRGRQRRVPELLHLQRRVAATGGDAHVPGGLVAKRCTQQAVLARLPAAHLQVVDNSECT